jgi:hypothetical protein
MFGPIVAMISGANIAVSAGMIAFCFAAAANARSAASSSSATDWGETAAISDETPTVASANARMIVMLIVFAGARWKYHG